MTDPLGFISGASRTGYTPPALPDRNPPEGGAFKDVLMDSLKDVNKAQQEATRAVEDLATGQRNDLEGVVLATQKADNAFRMLQSLRNRMIEAYEEIKQVRV